MLPKEGVQTVAQYDAEYLGAHVHEIDPSPLVWVAEVSTLGHHYSEFKVPLPIITRSP